ncbi:MAG TPA: arginase family protein, partial [Actinopolymorphaceae bacterium]|nr:arginase family protein [Actinopolymorphaceae bacterium]
MTVLGVAYHLDEPLGDFDFPLPPDHLVKADLPDGAPPWERMAELYDMVATEVAAAARTGATPLIQSGDCTTSLGVVAGLQRAGLTPGVVWFDAHGDIHTPESTASGYLGGMPLRMLAGEGDAS